MQEEQRDIAMVTWYSLGMQGLEESADTTGDLHIKIYFPDMDTAEQARLDLEERNLRSPVTVYKVEPQDWNAKWRESMEPAKIASDFWVSPIWLPPPIKQGDYWIKIEPKMAFGTGHHETTRLASQAIIAQKKWLPGKNILDIGTGSGILCLVADLCGARSCLGVEIDKDCLENLHENLEQNEPLGMVEFGIGTLECLKNDVAFDMVTMNMILTESTPCLPQVASVLPPGGLLIWSGILADEKDVAIDNAKVIASLKLIKEKTENEWWCGTFIKENE
jgi:ribosomal protein L11 methyltransferase